MAERAWAVRDEVWEAVEPLLPPRAPQTTGRPRVPDRTAFNAIVFVLTPASDDTEQRRSRRQLTHRRCSFEKRASRSRIDARLLGTTSGRD